MPKSTRSSQPWTRIVRIALVLGLIGYALYTAQQQQQQAPRNGPVVVEPQRPEAGKTSQRLVVPNVTVRYEDDGRIVTWRGNADLTATVARIRRGEKLSRWENDGDVFGNFERRLPARERGYYREWVHPTPQAPGPGPQRIVSGADGDLWYTPDHYDSFIRVDEMVEEAEISSDGPAAFSQPY
jgi:guanyl-specific ribonuclease Sa